MPIYLLVPETSSGTYVISVVCHSVILSVILSVRKADISETIIARAAKFEMLFLILRAQILASNFSNTALFSRYRILKVLNVHGYFLDILYIMFLLQKRENAIMTPYYFYNIGSFSHSRAS